MVDLNLGARGATGALPGVRNTGVPGSLAARVASMPRPSVLINEREISVLRRGLNKEGWKRALYLQPASKHHGVYVGAGLLSAANRGLEMDTSIPERSGHYHHFFCECGTRLSIPDDLRPLPEYICPACGHTYSGERYDGAVRYLRHQGLASAVLSLAVVHLIERDKTYSDKAAAILRNYALAYPGPHTDLTTGGMLYQSLCEAVWVIPLAQAYDLIYYSRSLNEEDRELIEDSLFRPVADGLMRVGIVGNWGSWHLSAVGIIGLAIKDVDLVRYALESFASQIGEQLGDDGLWPESVHTYHFYPLRAFVHLAEGCYRAGIDIYNWEVRPGKSLKAMFTAPLYYMYPSFRLPAINDGWYDSFLPLDLYEIALRRWNDPAFAWVLKRGYRFAEAPVNEDQRRHADVFRRTSFYAFMFGRDLPGRSASPALRNRDFSSLGVCTLRSPDGAMVTLDHGKLLGHGHLDKLSFTFYGSGACLVPDYGTPGYGSGIVDWYRSTASHNTVVVDGRSQEPAGESRLLAHYSGGFIQFAEANAADHYPGVVQTRRALLVGGRFFMDDLLVSEEEHDYDWMVRCEGEFVPGKSYEPCRLDCSCHQHIQIDRAYRLAEGCRFDWRCEQGVLAMLLWSGAGGGEVGLGTCPAETTERRVPITVWRQRGRVARFVSLLASSPDGGLEISRHGCVVRIAEGDEVDHVYLRGPGAESSEAMLQTDGEVAVVRLREGEVYAIGIVRGSWLSWMGEHILECPSTVDCVEVSFSERHPSIRYCCDTAGVVKLKTDARAMRINGIRAAAANSDGQAMLRVTSQMLGRDAADLRS